MGPPPHGTSTEHQRASPTALRDHLAGAHSWPVDGIRYGSAMRLRVSESDPMQYQRLLATGDDEGGEVLFLAVADESSAMPTETSIKEAASLVVLCRTLPAGARPWLGGTGAGLREVRSSSGTERGRRRWG